MAPTTATTSSGARTPTATTSSGPRTTTATTASGARTTVTISCGATNGKHALLRRPGPGPGHGHEHPDPATRRDRGRQHRLAPAAPGDERQARGPARTPRVGRPVALRAAHDGRGVALHLAAAEHR